MNIGAPNTFIGRAALMVFLLCTTALAQQAGDPQPSDSESYRQIVATEPHLPNRPARRENISDDEVREVQKAALEVYPDFIVVISGVTEGCECEEGSHCSAQVGLALNRDNTTRSLVLSKIDGHWKVGAVQSWWFRYVEFESTHPRPTSWEALQAWQRERQTLLEKFPACPVPSANWTLLRKGKFGSTFVDMSSMTVSGSIRRVSFKNVRDPPTWKASSLWVRFSIALEAFDCKDHRERTDKLMFYHENRTVLQGPVTDPVLWNPVMPNTISAADLDLVCGWKEKE